MLLGGTKMRIHIPPLGVTAVGESEPERPEPEGRHLLPFWEGIFGE